MQIDLILATIGRKDTIVTLLESISRQTHKDIRILLVDQNPIGFLDDIINRFRNLPDFPEIVYLRSKPGLSRARNVGLQNLKGDAFGLLDDDVVYQPETLASVSEALSKCDVAIGTLQESPFENTKRHKTNKAYQLRSVYEAFYKAQSVTLFFRQKVADSLTNGFPENIGAGTDSPYGSGAETDFLIRAMLANFTVQRHSDIYVHHPPIDVSAQGAPAKARRYGRGRWHIIQKHKLNKLFILVNALYSLLQMTKHPFNKDHVSYQWQQTLGRLGK